MTAVTRQPTPEDRVRIDIAVERAVAAERERCAKIAEDMPDRVLLMYLRDPTLPPGNTTYVHISGQKLIANAIRKSE